MDEPTMPGALEPLPADATADASIPDFGSTPGDVSSTPSEPSDPVQRVDAGTETGLDACEPVLQSAPASEVTTLEATVRQDGDASLDQLLAVGEAVAIDGDTLAVAALRHASQIEHGSVLVYVRSGESWVKQAELLPPDVASDNWFGQTLALSGDTLAVGAPEEFFDPPYPRAGSVHVFTRSDGVWQLEETLTAETPLDGDQFGGALALDGDTLAATVHADSVGRVEVFERATPGASFERVQTLQPPRLPETVSEYDWLGSIALAGDVLAVSVHPTVGDPAMRVEVYERGATGWQPTARVVGDRPPETFGIALALEGDTMVVGDSYLGSARGGQTPTGGAYVFERACDKTWTQRALLTADTEFLGGNFGRAVAIDGERIVVANPHDPTDASGIDGPVGPHDIEDDYLGAVYVFGRDGDGYVQLNFLKPSADAPRETYFGWALAASGGHILAGARGQDAAYVFR